ncbi:hypothetical protein ABZ876_20190 [Streptomyces sp. NPDC046931]|uniref:hypothetical protein n=1 Tax=Streptomyces sp. NPDC046931 TaxID=3154806 RepID=UPI0033E22B43
MMSETGRQARRRWRRRLGARSAGDFRGGAGGAGPKRWVFAVDGAGGPLAFAALVVVAVLVGRDPELRTAVWTFVRGL